MEKEALEVIDSSEDSINLVYEQPNFGKRVFANFLDIIFLFLTFVGFFIIAQKSSEATPIYQHYNNIVAVTRENSKIFRYSSARKTWENISTFLDNNNDVSYSSRVYMCQDAIDEFIVFIHDNCSESEYNEVVKNYDDSRLSSKMVDSQNYPLFVKTTVEGVEKIVHNPSSTANGQYYYEHFYREYTLVNCGGYLISFFPEYRDALRGLSNTLFFVQLPVALFSSGFVVYYLPGLIFRRGRPTFGKKINGIGTVDSNVLSPSFGRFTAKFAIFFFGEVVLSLFTFGVPLIVSFSMMAFTKRKTGFPDYMLGLTEVDTNKQKIYFSKYEIAVEHASDHKEAIDFRLIDKE